MGRSIKLDLPKVAVTGGIAAGKSTVCRYFEELGAYVVSADQIVHQLLVPSTLLGDQIVALLGHSIVVEGTLSRERIAQIVFHDPHLLKELEKIIHPEVQKEIDRAYKAASQKNAPLFVVEIPLLYESHLEKHFDAVVVVTCDQEISQERYARTNHDFQLRNKHLMPLSIKVQKADYVIDNNGSLEELHKQIQFIYRELKEKL